MKRALLLFLIGWMTVILVLTPLAVAPAAVLATASGPALSRQVLDVKKLPADLALASSADEKIKPLKKPAPQPPPMRRTSGRSSSGSPIIPDARTTCGIRMKTPTKWPVTWLAAALPVSASRSC